MFSQLLSFIPTVSMTSVSSSQRPIEWPSQVGLRSLGWLRPSKKTCRTATTSSNSVRKSVGVWITLYNCGPVINGPPGRQNPAGLSRKLFSNHFFDNAAAHGNIEGSSGLGSSLLFHTPERSGLPSTVRAMVPDWPAYLLRRKSDTSSPGVPRFGPHDILISAPWVVPAPPARFFFSHLFSG